MGFTCNLKAISVTDRPRYTALVTRLRGAIQERTEVADGYSYRIDNGMISLPEAEEWGSMERLCCPFLSLQMTALDQRSWTLLLTGPEGVKPLLNAEF